LEKTRADIIHSKLHAKTLLRYSGLGNLALHSHNHERRESDDAS